MGFELSEFLMLFAPCLFSALRHTSKYPHFTISQFIQA